MPVISNSKPKHGKNNPEEQKSTRSSQAALIPKKRAVAPHVSTSPLKKAKIETGPTKAQSPAKSLAKEPKRAASSSPLKKAPFTARGRRGAAIAEEEPESIEMSSQ